MGLSDWFARLLAPAPKGDTEPIAGPTGDAAPPARGKVAPGNDRRRAAPYTAAETPCVRIDVSEGEALALINKLTIALGHAHKYGNGERFTVSTQIRLEGSNFVSGRLSFYVYTEGNPPP